MIRLLVTGGTFDKEYDELHGTLFFRNTHVTDMLRLGRNGVPAFVQVLMMTDSLDMTAGDRKTIVDACLDAPESQIVVTHGTDTMVETAAVLDGIAGKTIILTGALNPARFRGSDAEFNIGTAVGAVQSLPEGVYIAMNGRVWDPRKVRKNVAANRFEAIG